MLTRFKIFIFYISKFIFISLLIALIGFLGFFFNQSYRNSIDDDKSLNTIKKTGELYNCKFGDIPGDDINQVSFYCGTTSKTMQYVKFASIELPKIGDCNYEAVKTKIIEMKPFTYTIKISYEKEGKLYGYIYSGNKNINEEFIKNGFGKYIENGDYLKINQGTIKECK